MLVIGLDCLEPSLAFDRYLDSMPTLRGLLAESTWGTLRSCDPPITVPAWMVMATSADPGTLGAYGFRHRAGASYTDGWTANALTFDTPAVWDRIAAAGRHVCLLAVPPSFPALEILGVRVGCFLTPKLDARFTHPPELARELLEVVPDYEVDVEFRISERDRLLADLHAMLDGHFDAAEHLLTTRLWDLFWLVEIGTDRVHHAFWKFADPAHPYYEPGNRFESAIRDYYAHVDRRVGELLRHVGDETAVLVVSDHGAKAMRGAFAVNEWLGSEGWLALEAANGPSTPLERCAVDWTRTRAWAWGGYYARVFLNVRGREQAGVVREGDVERTLEELTEGLLEITDHEGRRMSTRVLRPADTYRTVRGDPPDLMVYFDDLSWRAAGA